MSKRRILSEVGKKVFTSFVSCKQWASVTIVHCTQQFEWVNITVISCGQLEMWLQQTVTLL